MPTYRSPKYGLVFDFKMSRREQASERARTRLSVSLGFGVQTEQAQQGRTEGQNVVKYPDISTEDTRQKYYIHYTRIVSDIIKLKRRGY